MQGGKAKGGGPLCCWKNRGRFAEGGKIKEGNLETDRKKQGRRYVKK